MDIKDISFRRIRSDETALLVDHRILFLKELQGEQPLDQEQQLRVELTAYFSCALKQDTFVGWIAEYEHHPAGIGGMVIQQIPGHFKLMNGMEGYVLNMYTLPGYRKMGICGELIRRLINEARLRGLNKVYLHASNDGIGIYRKFGFHEPDLPELELTIH